MLCVDSAISSGVAERIMYFIQEVRSPIQPRDFIESTGVILIVEAGADYFSKTIVDIRCE